MPASVGILAIVCMPRSCCFILEAYLNRQGSRTIYSNKSACYLCNLFVGLHDCIRVPQTCTITLYRALIGILPTLTTFRLPQSCSLERPKRSDKSTVWDLQLPIAINVEIWIKLHHATARLDSSCHHRQHDNQLSQTGEFWQIPNTSSEQEGKQNI